MADFQFRFDELLEKHTSLFKGIDRFDLLILRHHGLLEVALQDLLAVRLKSDVKEFGDLTFAKLARLALAGLGPELRKAVLELNTLRNYAAHDISAGELEQRCKTYFTSAPFHAPWPAEPDKRLLAAKAALLVLSNTIASLAMGIAEFRKDEREKHKDDTTWTDEQGVVDFICRLVDPLLRVDHALARYKILS